MKNLQNKEILKLVKVTQKERTKDKIWFKVVLVLESILWANVIETSNEVDTNSTIGLFFLLQ